MRSSRQQLDIYPAWLGISAFEPRCRQGDDCRVIFIDARLMRFPRPHADFSGRADTMAADEVARVSAARRLTLRRIRCCQPPRLLFEPRRRAFFFLGAERGGERQFPQAQYRDFLPPRFSSSSSVYFGRYAARSISDTLVAISSLLRHTHDVDFSRCSFI